MSTLSSIGIYRAVAGYRYRRRARRADMTGERRGVARDGLFRGGVHGAVAFDDFEAERREGRGAAAAPAERGGHGRRVEQLVEAVDQQPARR